MKRGGDHEGLRREWALAADHDASRQVLRKMALQLIREKGPYGISMRQLATRLGVSAMTAYRYYPHKEALLIDLKLDVARKLAGALEEAGAMADEPRGRLRHAGAAYLRFALSHEQEYRLLFDASFGIVIPEEKKAKPIWQIAVELVRNLGAISDPERVELLARHIWASVHGLAMLHLSGRIALEQPIEVSAAPHLDLIAASVEAGLDRPAAPAAANSAS